jgi:hypothetical protein
MAVLKGDEIALIISGVDKADFKSDKVCSTYVEI